MLVVGSDPRPFHGEDDDDNTPPPHGEDTLKAMKRAALGYKDDAPALYKLLRAPESTVCELDLRCATFNDSSARELGTALASCQSLERVNFYGARRVCGFAHVIDSLRACRELREVNLRMTLWRGYETDACVDALARLVAESPSLRAIDVSACGLDNEGLARLGAALRASFVERIDVSEVRTRGQYGRYLSPSANAIAAFALGVQEAPCLKHVVFRGVPLGEHDESVLSDAARASATVTCMDLRGLREHSARPFTIERVE